MLNFKCLNHQKCGRLVLILSPRKCYKGVIKKCELLCIFIDLTPILFPLTLLNSMLGNSTGRLALHCIELWILCYL